MVLPNTAYGKTQKKGKLGEGHPRAIISQKQILSH
jgi:hypothetical protein